MEIPLSKRGKKHKGQYAAIVDDIDIDLAGLRWRVFLNSHNQYAYQSTGRKFMHRTVMERMLGRSVLSEELVDHINGNGLDNRRENLRVATNKQNLRNRRKHITNSTGYKGVYQYKYRYYAKIRVNGKLLHLGFFSSSEEAYEAYKQAALKHFGEFAKFE